MPSEYWEKNMEHGLTREYYEGLMTLLSFIKPKSVFEIGTGWGISGSAFLDSGVERLVSVDVNLDSAYGKLAQEELYLKRGHASMELVCERIEKVATYWLSVPERFDLVYIDGDHGYEGCARDLSYAHSLIKRGGTIVLDDYLHVNNFEGDYGIVRAVREYLVKTKKSGTIFATRENGFVEIPDNLI